MRHHPPDMPPPPPTIVVKWAGPGQYATQRCRLCGGDPMDEIHWPPRGWRERLRAFVGLY